VILFKAFHVQAAVFLKREAFSQLTNLITHWYNLTDCKCYYIIESSPLLNNMCVTLPYVTFVLYWAWDLCSEKYIVHGTYIILFILQALQLELRSHILLGQCFYLILRLPLYFLRVLLLQCEPLWLRWYLEAHWSVDNFLLTPSDPYLLANCHTIEGCS